MHKMRSISYLEDGINFYTTRLNIYILLIPLFMAGFLCTVHYALGGSKAPILRTLSKIVEKVWELNATFGIYVTPEAWLLQSFLYRLEGNDIKAQQAVLKANAIASDLLIGTEARILYEMARFNCNETERKAQLSKALALCESEDVSDKLFARFIRNLLDDNNFIIGKTGLEDIYPTVKEICTESTTIKLQLPLNYKKKLTCICNM